MNAKIALGAALAGAFALGAIAVGYSNAQSSKSVSNFSKKDEDAIRAIIADYIAQNPEAILESLNAHVEREREQIALELEQKTKDYLPALISEDGAYTTGAGDNAKVAVVEFFDYHCGYCKRASGLVRELATQDPEVRVVFRELPILREESEIAARYALASRAQGKYQELHFELLDAKGVLTEKRIEDLAKKAGLNVSALKNAVKSDASLQESINANRDVARELGLDGTPSFIVASLETDFMEVIPGFSPEDVKAAIDEAKRSGEEG